MVTKRKFLTMAVMMFVLLFMFQFTQVVKEVGNEYDTNEYATKPNPASEESWQMNCDVTKISGEDSYAILIGSIDSDIGNIVRQWCTYTKRDLFVYESIATCSGKLLMGADVVMLDADYIDYEKEVSMLSVRAEQGMNVVFCNLPEPDVIEGNSKLQRLLGIEEVKSDEISLEGINLFSGFLLGGQAIYEPKNEEEKQERQDLDLNVPWYLTGNASKTYMVGILNDTSVKNEQLPAIIWRNAVGKGKVFAVNGAYMADSTGIGILDAMMAECQEYEVYPVVNAQSLAVANFPGLASENEEEMKRLYSRDQVAVYRDILWPSLYSTVEKGGSQLTCYLAPQFDYTDDREPQKDSLIFYLKQLKEKGAEAGLSMEHKEGTSLAEKLARDEAFFKEADTQYQFGAAYVPEVDTGIIEEWNSSSRYQTLDTVVSPFRKGQDIVSYIQDSVTQQSITSSGISHTFGEDLRMKSLQTALGYSNIVLDMNQISWPETEKDRWEIVSEQFSSNINTYWKPFEMFAQTTASESDANIRAFLAMDYEDSKEGNTICLNVKKTSEDVWMILRTHREEIDTMQGGKYSEIEDGAYLLCIQEATCEITLKSKDLLKYPLS